jgi:H+/gluconate symporter-like permease
LNTARKIFLALFIISTLGVLVLFVGLPMTANIAPSTALPAMTENPNIEPTASPGNPGVEPSPQNTKMGTAALIGSILTSITSLIGFITTTVITWRKEKREASLAEVERKRLETELERSQFELERLKKRKTKK